ncbi:MAG: dTDP-glucose 4,6-dehydratase, partial [Clostridia bacterium]|nr:dTDP-glucose 4,6-dehydratase [Clostridia bacterium]
GSNFIKYLLEKNNEILIVNLDKLTYAGSLKNLAGMGNNQNYRFVKADICNSSEIQELFAVYKPDYVLNFAAESHVDRSIKDSRAFIETNVLGTQVLLQAALKYQIKKFIQISTDEVYGASDGVKQHDETAALLPGNPYAASKAAADLLVMSYYHTYGLPVAITRCSNNFGPYQYREKLIPLVINKCLRGEQIPVYGDGLQTRDWIFVEDHCSAVLKVLEKGTVGEIYNISADNKIQNLILIKLIIKHLRQLLPDNDPRKVLINESLISFVDDRKGHDRGYYINAHKVRSQLDWSSTHSFDEAFKATIKWHLMNIN